MPRHKTGGGESIYFGAKWLPLIKRLAAALNNKTNAGQVCAVLDEIRKAVEALPEK